MESLLWITTTVALGLLVGCMVLKERADTAEAMAEEMEIRASRAEVENAKLKRAPR